MEKSNWRWGFNRWLVLFFIIAGWLAARSYPPIRPHVQLPAEPLSHHPLFTLPVIGDFYLTNTLVALVLVDIILLLLAFSIRQQVKSGGKQMLKGMGGAVEALLEALYGMTESTAGKWAKAIFPYFATIMLMVLVANWMELIPGVDSIGFLEKTAHEGYVANGPFLLKAEPAHGAEGFVVVPWVRVVSTDLNFTVALALISVFMTQVIGIRAQGAAYFTKFWNTHTLFSKPIFGAIDFGVGLLEIISEFSKILSFSFRLFGNIFAGSVMLFVIGALVPVFAQSLVLLLEAFVGIIQALVFGMLTMTFMAQATQGHGEHHDEAHA